MNEYTASNGVRIIPTNGGATLYSPGESWPISEAHTVFANADVVTAMREFFQHERDEELGRWRYPLNPDFLVLHEKRSEVLCAGGKFHYRSVVVVEESSMSSMWCVDRDPNSEMGRGEPVKRHGGEMFQIAARAYFDAHPERKQPWHYAKEGQVWIIEYNGHEFPAIFQADAFRDHGGSRDADSITAARRIWPADAS